MKNFGFNPSEIKILKKLNTPLKIQNFLDNGLKYNLEEDKETYFSPRLVLRKKKAHCFEGALFAAAALRLHGHTPLLIDLKAVRDEDHVLAIHKIKNRWGSIALSKFSGLKFRDAVYSSIRELVMSYFEHYYNYNREKTLREYSVPIDLSRFDSKDWMTSEESLEYIADFIDSVKHYKIFPRGIKNLRRIDSRRLKSELIVKPKK